MPESVSDAWRRLSLFESNDLISELHKAHHDRKPNSRKRQAIISHVMQGRQYFAVSRQSSDLIRPLLLYYGILSLVRALIIFQDTRPDMHEVSPSHGLEMDVEGHLRREGNPLKQLPDVRINIRSNGTFADLTKTTRNTERISLFYRPVPTTFEEMSWTAPERLKRTTHEAIGCEGIPNTISISVREILSIIPDVSPTYNIVFGDRSSCIPISGIIYPELQETTITIPRGDWVPEDEAILRSKFRIPDEVTIQQHSSSDRPFSAYTLQIPNSFASVLPGMRNDTNGDLFFSPPLASVHFFSTLSSLYLVCYAMGMLARYYPSQWLCLLSGYSGDATLPILREALDIAERRSLEIIAETFEKSIHSLHRARQGM